MCQQEGVYDKDKPDLTGTHYAQDDLRRVGEGSYGAVFSTLDTTTGERVAIKHYQANDSANREKIYLSKLGGQHHVPRLLSWGISAPSRREWIVIDYIDKVNFRDVVCTMHEKEMREYMFALLTALCHLHHHGVIHHDVKPGNFLYSPTDGKFLLVDFGMSHDAVSLDSKRMGVLVGPTVGSVAQDNYPSNACLEGTCIVGSKRKAAAAGLSSPAELKLMTAVVTDSVANANGASAVEWSASRNRVHQSSGMVCD